jgi:hypothetical protein
VWSFLVGKSYGQVVQQFCSSLAGASLQSKSVSLAILPWKLPGWEEAEDMIKPWRDYCVIPMWLATLAATPPYHQWDLDLFTPGGINVNKFKFKFSDWFGQNNLCGDPVRVRIPPPRKLQSPPHWPALPHLNCRSVKVNRTPHPTVPKNRSLRHHRALPHLADPPLPCEAPPAVLWEDVWKAGKWWSVC